VRHRGVAGADVVDGDEGAAGPPAREPLAQRPVVVDRLVLGDLEDVRWQVGQQRLEARVEQQRR
jgi:hypothetical protein